MKVGKETQKSFQSRFEPVRTAICQVYVKEPNKVRFRGEGSGVLVSIFGRKLLLTAAHVLDGFAGEQPYFFGGETAFSISGQPVRIASMADPKHSVELDDIAWVELSPTCVQKLLTSGYRFLERDEIDPPHQSSGQDMFSVVGFLAFKARYFHPAKPVEINARAYIGRELKLGEYSQKYDSGRHLLMHMPRYKATDLDSTNLFTAPVPKGLSGGGVFTYATGDGEYFQPVPPKLVGIFHRYSQDANHIGAATRMSAFVGAIVAKYSISEMSQEDAHWLFPNVF